MRCILICLALMLVSGLRSDADQLCGPRCLLYICRKMGVDATVDELVKASRCDPRIGSNLLDLQKVAEAKGLSAVAMKLRAEDLERPGLLSIACLIEGHFVVVDNDMVVDGDEARTTKWLRSRYSGYALLIAKNPATFPQAKDEGADVRFSALVHDYGFMVAGSAAVCEVKCTNVGSQTAVITSVKTLENETHVATSLSESTIAPGHSSVLRCGVNTTGLRGGFDKPIYIRSNDPIAPVACIRLIGGVRFDHLVAAPVQVELGRVHMGQAASQTVYLPDSIDPSSPNYSDMPLKMLCVLSTCPYITAKVTQQPSASTHRYTILVSLLPNAPVGQSSGSVSVHTNQGFLDIPVHALVLPKLEEVFLGVATRGKLAERTFGWPGIKAVSSSLPYVSARCEGGTLTVMLRADAPVGNIKGEVTIHTNDPGQPEIRVPVYAYVKQ